MASSITEDTDPPGKVRVLDMINTDRSARELLDHRVRQINATGRYENEILCSGGQYVEMLRAAGHTVHVVEVPRGMSPFKILVAVWATRRILKDRSIDIIHIHGTVIWLIAILAGWLARTPVVLAQVHGFHHHDNMPTLKRTFYILFQRFLCAGADPLLYQNQGDIDECVRARIAADRKNVLIGNGVQLDAFELRDPPDNEPPVVLCVSRLEPVKNHTMLLEAARILRDRGRRFVVHIVGDGYKRPEYEAWVQEHELTEFVKFLGYRSDVPALTAGADICALVSVKEGLPRAIVEAGVCGRPIVASEVIGSRECIQDGRTGFLVPLNDAAGLADKLELLMTDGDLRRRMGLAGRSLAQERFDECKVTDRIIQIYDRVMVDR